jgi:hypothetical protein
MTAAKVTLEAVLRIRIRRIFPDPDRFRMFLDPDPYTSIMSTIKINWKGKFNKLCLLLAPGRPIDTENQVKMYKKYRFRPISYLNSKDPDPYQIIGSGSVPIKVIAGSGSKRKVGSGSVSKWSGSARLARGYSFSCDTITTEKNRSKQVVSS